jgi:hypothetical protein
MTRGSPIFRFQVTRFVILFVERAGSTFLITVLRSHPSVLALTEKLAVLREEGKSAADQLAWAKVFLTPPLVGRHHAIGFKTKLVDVLDPAGLAQVLRLCKCRIIQLQRRNTVKGVVSTLNARRQWQVSGNWNLLNESTRQPAFVVDPSEFDALLQTREKLDRDLEQYVEQLQLPTLRLFYEDLLLDEQAFVGTVLSFLGSRNQPLKPVTLKNTGDDLRQAVLNFDELRTQYAGTRYEAMFDEVLAPA